MKWGKKGLKKRYVDLKEYYTQMHPWKNTSEQLNNMITYKNIG